ncbi:NAD-dependent epimerase/dehydratase family protein [Eubacterium sp.]|uniref:NAD-dependent epimerase/dehydratase family protein n=1 Tax=Eubacterium sp. TaxID=142586 RepID=UPI0025DCE64E|nr:NAD-dependent epimerase/dehydratase family protein [Eubacterium sp.]MCR5629492.1 reductase [Eubacterium sp.]
MNVLVIGGTRFFGIPMVDDLLKNGHKVTIATRGMAKDKYGDAVDRIIFDRCNVDSIKSQLSDKHFDVIIDKIAYCSNDIKNLLDVIDCDKYIYMSTTAVYNPKHMDTVESDFDASKGELIWCGRGDYPYDVIKRHAEYALWQKYLNKKFIAVRYPFVIGKDDYTNRIRFYVEHVMEEKPMNIDNVDYQMGYIRSDEAGDFISFLVDKEFEGAINGASNGTISLREIINYVEDKTGKKAVIDKNGDDAPYNGEVEYSINTKLAQSLGFKFNNLNDYIYDLIDYYIDEINRS